MNAKFENRKDLLIELVRTNFKLKYNNSLLGFIWVLLKPFAIFLVLYLVFSYFRGGWIENYQVYLLLGIILYTFFNEGIVYGMNGILSTAHIILKVNFPKEIALAASLIMALVNFFINFGVLIVFSFFNPVKLNFIALLYFVLIILIMFTLVYGISFFTSMLLVKLRDLQHVTELVMQLLFYGTPIFYPVNILPEKFQKIISLNPLAVLIQAARGALIYGEISSVKKVTFVMFCSLFILILGREYFRRNVKRVAEKF